MSIPARLSAMPWAQRKNFPALFKSMNLSTYYHHIHELTVPPQVLNNVEPSSNLTLTIDEVSDKPLQLRLMVNENGDIDDVEIEDSKLSLEATRLVKEQFHKMKFTPGMIQEFAVKSQLLIEVSLETASHQAEFIELSRKVLIDK
ncbi:energy transducer TonB [Undibacterium sp. Di27W]|uniref:energy transducer TonB n=1 Tax=Undibacterium sp. Di27W TaxID=3413036 RepID=UPI003BF13DC7